MILARCLLVVLLPAPGWAQVSIAPGTNIQTVINANPAGTTYTLQAGTHREQTIAPKAGDVFQGELSGGLGRLTTLSGARILSSWTPDSGRWYVTGQTQQGTPGDPLDCASTHPQCIYPEDLWFDSTSMKFREASLGATGAGEWFFDYAADRIYVGDDPTGHVVETSVTNAVFVTSGGACASTVDNVTIQSMIVEKYASSSAGPSSSAVNLGCSALGATGWLGTYLEVRHNHFAGIGNDTSTSSTNNHTHHNCNSGFVGSGIDVFIYGNEIAYNNILPNSDTAPCGFDPYWGAGGSKWVFTTDLTVEQNHAHHNRGPGLWTDINNVDAVYTGNRIEFNFRSGIVHEISFPAVIHTNSLVGNGTDTTYGDYTLSCGIEIYSSPGVEVYNNTLINNYNGICVMDDTRDLGDADHDLINDDSLAVVNTYIHDNLVIHTLATPGFQGMLNAVDDTGTGAPFQGGANNRWVNNRYCLSGGQDPYFRWAGANKTNAEWVAAGMDLNNLFLACVDNQRLRLR